jgi:hypothetical protein
MIQKKILVLAPYPIKNPQHGGQKRIKALVDYYRTLFTEVKFVAIFDKAGYQDYDHDDIAVGTPELLERLKQPESNELTLGEAVDSDIHIRSPLAKILREYNPDVLHVEQVYLYLGLAPLLQELDLHPRLIFGSQNIESRMKKEIFKGLNIPTKTAMEVIERIEKLERQFSQEADLVIAVSEEDAKVHTAMGARRYVVAPNGIEKTESTKQGQAPWVTFKRKHDIATAITFIGSGHPPNWIGFLKTVGDDLSFLPQKANILIAGGVASYFEKTYKYETKAFPKFWKGALPVGRLSEDALAGLIHETDILLLPITSGGGSNLKTAEAILSGKKVVATTYAFRAFEQYLSLPNIYIANTKRAFQKALVRAVTTPYKKRTDAEQALAEKVQWRYCLSPIADAMKKVVRRTPKEWLHDAVRQYTPTPLRVAIVRLIRR